MAVPQQSPSSAIYHHAPIVVLVILGIMMTIPNMFVYDPAYLAAQIAQVQTHFVVGAFLIPVCLLLAVQTLGIPKINQLEPRIPPPLFVQAVTKNLTTSMVLVVVIFVLLILIPLRGGLQPPPTYVRKGWR